jgi:hypothetical protein
VEILERDLGPDVAAIRVVRDDGSELIIINPSAGTACLDEHSGASGA